MMGVCDRAGRPITTISSHFTRVELNLSNNCMSANRFDPARGGGSIFGSHAVCIGEPVRTGPCM